MGTPLYYVLGFLHVIFLAIGFGAVIVIDTFGLLWIFKRVKLEFVNKVADITQRLIWHGWFGLVITGAILLTMKGSVSNLTQIKIFFVAMLGLNGIFLHFTKKGLEALKNQENIPAVFKFRIGLASTISQMGWWGAIVIGFLNTRVTPKIPGPENPFYYMIAILGGFVLIGLIGNAVLKDRK